jgi:hypothetical protein
VIFSSGSKSLGAADKVATLPKLGMLTSKAVITLKAIALVFIGFSAVCIIPVLPILTRVAIAQFRLMFKPFVADYSAKRCNPKLRRRREAPPSVVNVKE